MSTAPLSAVQALELANEVAELRQQLAAAQDLLVETAADAGQLHAENAALQDELACARAELATWQIAARVRGRVVA